jgi:hypothetical protein
MAGQPSQQPATEMRPGNGVILGQVIDAGTGRPVPGAMVRLLGGTDRPIAVELGRAAGPAGPPAVLTNRDGRFLFRNLPAGSYNASVSIPGYTPGAFGRRRLDGPGRPIVIGENDRVLDATIRVWKMAAIAGTVTDEAGEPVIGIGVMAFRRVVAGGRRRLVTSGLRGQTDDRGIFRIAALTPGEYIVAVPITVTSTPVSSADEYTQAMQTGSSTAIDAVFQQRSESGAPFSEGGGIVVGDQQVSLAGSMGMPGLAAAAPTIAGGRFLVYPTVFHGGANPSQAAVIALGSGDTRTGVDLRLRAASTTKVSGVVIGPEGPVSNLGVRLVAPDLDESGINLGLDTALTMTDGAGRFTFPGVPAGQYILRAYRVPQQRFSVGLETFSVVGGVTTSPIPPPMQQQAVATLWAQSLVTVGGDDLTDVAVSLRPGLRVTGRVDFQGAQAAPQPLPPVTVTLQPMDGRVLGLPIPPGRLDAAGAFTTSGYPPGRYWVNVAAPLPGWVLKSIQAGGVNLIERPLDLESGDISDITVTFTDRTSDLSGTATGASGPNDDVSIVVFPADYQTWLANGRAPRRTATALADRNGAYQLRLPPPGDYIVAAVLNGRTGELELAEYSALARQGTRISVGEGEKKTVVLTAREIR